MVRFLLLYSLLLFHSGGLSGAQVPQIVLRYVRDFVVAKMPSHNPSMMNVRLVRRSRKSWNARIQAGTRCWAEIGGLRGGQLQPTDFAAGRAYEHTEQGNAGADHLCSSSKRDAEHTRRDTTWVCCVHAVTNPDLFLPLHAALSLEPSVPDQLSRIWLSLISGLTYRRSSAGCDEDQPEPTSRLAPLRYFLMRPCDVMNPRPGRIHCGRAWMHEPRGTAHALHIDFFYYRDSTSRRCPRAPSPWPSAGLLILRRPTVARHAGAARSRRSAMPPANLPRVVIPAKTKIPCAPSVDLNVTQPQP